MRIEGTIFDQFNKTGDIRGTAHRDAKDIDLLSVHRTYSAFAACHKTSNRQASRPLARNPV
jgi:hypothetical protein